MNTKDIIKSLQDFKSAINDWEESTNLDRNRELRTYINRNIVWVRQQVIEAGCFVTMTIGPPPIIGGLVLQNQDPFYLIFDPPYDESVIPIISDMIDRTIGVIQNPQSSENNKISKPEVKLTICKNYAFIAMAMEHNNPALEDILDSIKESAKRCGIQAERIDEPESNERITDRILESINKAEYVIVELTHSKPNVYFEAGYAHGLCKIPIYLAKEGTKIEFDLKDYPIIFYQNMKQLKDKLEKRIRGLSKSQKDN